jgi:hypothetical protein
VQVCRSYLHGRGLVWFNISQDNAGGWLNEEITLGKHTGPGCGLVWSRSLTVWTILEAEINIALVWFVLRFFYLLRLGVVDLIVLVDLVWFKGAQA